MGVYSYCLLPCMWFQPTWILRVAWSMHSSFTRCVWPTFLHVSNVGVCGSEEEAPAAESSVVKIEGEAGQWESDWAVDVGVARGDFWDSS